MALRVNTTANVLLRDLDTHGPEKTDTTASVAVKRKFGDATCAQCRHRDSVRSCLNDACMAMGPPGMSCEMLLTLPDIMRRYSLRVTESTIKNIRALNGVLVQMSKPLGTPPPCCEQLNSLGAPFYNGILADTHIRKDAVHRGVAEVQC